MQSLPESLLSIMVPNQQSSRVYHNPIQRELLQYLRQQLIAVVTDFEKFKEKTLQQTRESIGRISSLLFRSAKERSFLESQLQKSKQIQNTMRTEVIQLKEMINDALKECSRDIHFKNQQIKTLKQQLVKEREKNGRVASEEIRIEDHKNEEESLEIIQEQSEQATFSSMASLRQFRQEEGQESNVSKNEISIVPQSHFKSIDPQFKEEIISETTSKITEAKQEPKRTKIFIDNFRKNIEKSGSQIRLDFNSNILPSSKLNNKQNQKQTVVKKWISQKIPSTQPLRDIGNCQSPKYFSKALKPSLNMAQTIYVYEQPISNSSSSSQLGYLSEVQKESQINKVPVAQSSNFSFLKKKSTHQRFKTEPDRPYPNSCHKPTNSFSKTDKKSHCERSFSDSKSVKTSKSKEKIKVTSRMIEDRYQPRKNHNAATAKALVHLGGKCTFRRFLGDLKQAFIRYKIEVGSPLEQYQYVGDLVRKLRWGRGKLVYRNGLVYEGEFRENKRHGRGSLILNGISIYEGEWSEDKISGEGYLKSMKFLSLNCPPLFEEASYCGNLQEGKLHGIGTIFLNQKEKIVTKFRNGVPLGDLTYYNLQEIQFGIWPNE